MYYVEIAQGSPKNRGTLVPFSKLKNFVIKEPLYRSVYLYDNTAFEHAQKALSLKKYEGIRAIDKVIIDIDKADNSDNHTLNFARATIFELQELGLSTRSMQAYFSGTGYHIAIPNSAFGFEPSANLPLIVKATMTAMLPDIDISVYIRTGLYRVAHTLNLKTNLYKIPLTTDEVNKLKPDDIQLLATKPRTDFPYAELLADGELEEHVKHDINKYDFRTKMRTFAEPTKVVPCIQSLMRDGPVIGTRHNTALRIVSHLKRNGIPSGYAIALLNFWNNDSLDTVIIEELVHSVYKGSYRYSCNDVILKARCQTRCIYFKHKDYNINVQNATDLQDDLANRLTTDFSGRTIDLAKSLGITDKDAEIYPGELVTIFGPTGSSKTTLAQNLALGVDFNNDRIVSDWQIPTLYLSLELSAWYMHRRHLQIVSNKDKAIINEEYKDIFEKHEQELGHIAILTIAPTLDQIKEKIRDLQPAVVIVDYIDLVECPVNVRGEYEKIKYISHGLSNMAVNMDLIIIQISQVGREYSRNEVLDLYAGKGSGAIENASRKVIGLNGQADSPKKTLNMYKNTDGELFSCDLEWRPSFRLRRV